MRSPALLFRLSLSLGAALLAACASNQSGPPPGPAGRGGPGGMRGQRMPGDTLPMAAPNTTARADLRDVNGASVGTVTLTQTAHGVLITGDLSSLPPGVHAIHVHDSGRCEPPFTSAGGHYNPAMRSHGFRANTGNHAGDLPNFSVGTNGTGHVETISRDLTLAQGGGLFDGDGSSIVIHGGPDDYQSDPAGNSGPRIACGLITH
ncbi:superoxide dismutase copper/zinc binding protein [Gemmatirosa kalamazoonensis]|uniref:Superoxide dismutase [Cu-Zn] n=1 Tax=Gemmatirosa kalamazoonensis TaxID=861299 RepID=W0RJS0_9BACT|nr:superoxide dismutase family protein [Gemmatirosa kalamazoonensis]AHG91324.1 superoxide dismutase copper/zinc binding protein [Gemmatirosa kalamazoonensis]